MLKKLTPVLLPVLLFSCGQPASQKTDTATSAPVEPAIETVAKAELPTPEITKKTYKSVSGQQGVDAEAFYDLPQVSGDFPNLRKALSDKELLGENIKDIVKEFSECSCGTSGFTFKVTYTSPQAVSLDMTTEGMGAYPSTDRSFRTLDPQTGKKRLLSDEITPEGLKWMLKTYKKTLRERAKKLQKDAASDPGTGIEDLNELMGALDEDIEALTTDNLKNDYVFTAKGVKVISPFFLPHAFLALEPDRVVEFPVASLKPYLSSSAIILKK